MIKGIHHISIVVPDLEKGLKFYTEVLGFELLWRSTADDRNELYNQIIGLSGIEAEVAMMSAGGVQVELWQYHKPQGKAGVLLPCDQGYTHIALDVTDIDAEYQRLIDAGMTFHGPPVEFSPGTFAVYGKDPFGNYIEILQTGSAL